MGDDVVQLAGDPQPFLFSAAGGLLLAGPLGEREAFLQHTEVGAVGADLLGDEQRDRDQHHVPERLQHPRLPGMQEVGEEDCTDRCDCSEQLDWAAAAERERVERDGRREHRHGAGGAVDVEQHRHQSARDDERPTWRSVACKQRPRCCKREHDGVGRALCPPCRSSPTTITAPTSTGTAASTSASWRRNTATRI